jgi:LPXTG-site transpeptidase (sortase) family protein
VFIGILLAASSPVAVLAVDNYHFINRDDTDFHRPGATAVTYDGPIPNHIQLLYDFTPQTVHDSSFGATIIAPPQNQGFGHGPQTPKNAPGGSVSGSGTGLNGNPTSDPVTSPVFFPDTPAFISSAPQQFRVTPLHEVRNPDRSIGVLSIPRIGLTITAYDGDTFAAMERGVGHIASTSSWNSNVGLIGHNRGINSHFGRLNQLRIGDFITYTTRLGTRQYEVVFVGTIRSNDWTLLPYTVDNRITLITCVANRPELRLAVQAVELIR